MRNLSRLLFLCVLLFACVILFTQGAKSKEKKREDESGQGKTASKQATTTGADKKKKTIKHDPNDHKGLTAFFLTDPTDGTCLGPNGFVMCDENALWLLTTRPGRKTYSLLSLLAPSQNICLQRKTTFFGLIHTDQLVSGSCNTKSAKSWSWDWVDADDHVKLSNLGRCIVRGKHNSISSSVSVQDCERKDFTKLKYHVTAVHENGFLLATANGECFDGEKFRSCYTSGSSKALSSLYWGIGIRYVWGEAKRYFFSFAPQERNKCLVYDGNNKVHRGACESGNALTWGLQHGRLSVQNGKKCVVRKGDDSAALTNCNEGNEYILMNVPVTGVSDNVMSLLNSPVSVLFSLYLIFLTFDEFRIFRRRRKRSWLTSFNKERIQFNIITNHFKSQCNYS